VPELFQGQPSGDVAEIPRPTVLLPRSAHSEGGGSEPAAEPAADESAAAGLDQCPPAVDVLAVGAHPDDVEFACGGTLAKLSRQGYRVGIIDLTDGQPTPFCDDVTIRLTESVEAAQILGVDVRVQLNLPNRSLMDNVVARIALARQFRFWRPRIVLGFLERTPMHSPDHWQAGQITDAAVFYSRLCRWEAYFPGLPIHAIRQQLYFQMSWAPAIPVSGLFVDVGDTLETKLASVAAYATQFDHKPMMIERIRAAAIAQGAATGCDAAESFLVAQPFAVDDLVETVLGRPPLQTD